MEIRPNGMFQNSIRATELDKNIASSPVQPKENERPQVSQDNVTISKDKDPNASMPNLSRMNDFIKDHSINQSKGDLSPKENLGSQLVDLSLKLAQDAAARNVAASISGGGFLIGYAFGSDSQGNTVSIPIPISIGKSDFNAPVMLEHEAEFLNGNMMNGGKTIPPETEMKNKWTKVLNGNEYNIGGDKNNTLNDANDAKKSEYFERLTGELKNVENKSYAVDIGEKMSMEFSDKLNKDMNERFLERTSKNKIFDFSNIENSKIGIGDILGDGIMNNRQKSSPSVMFTRGIDNEGKEIGGTKWVYDHGPKFGKKV